MFDETTLSEILEEGRLPICAASDMMCIYVADHDWKPHIERLFSLISRNLDEEEAKARVRTILSFTILLPALDKSIKIDFDNPSNNLFKWHYFDRFGKEDWFLKLQEVVRQDVKITDFRSHLLQLGVIDPIEYQPHSRQAFKWMCEHAEASGVTLTADLRAKFKNLVMIYGGVVCSYIFEKHQRLIRSIPNWRSGYFFERAIHDAYKQEQILKIKATELKNTNPKLVKQIAKERAETA